LQEKSFKAGSGMTRKKSQMWKAIYAGTGVYAGVHGGILKRRVKATAEIKHALLVGGF